MWMAFLIFSALSLNNANAIYELDSTTVTINKKGQSVTHRLLKIKILNDVGRDRYGDIKVRYNKETSIFKIIHAYTLLENGRKVKVEKDAVMDVGAPETAMAPEYTNVQVKAVSFPALAKNTIIVYEYEIKSKKGEKDSPLFGSVFFRTKEPIKKKAFVLRIPKDRKLNYAVYGDSIIKVSVDTSKKYITYAFWVDNVNKIPEEEFLPPMYEISERVDYATFKDKNEMAKWIFNKFSKKLGSKTDALRKTAMALKGNSKTETFYKVVEYVQENIKNVPLYLWDAGFTPHSPEWTLNHKYGDVRDKTVLAIALLKELGIHAEPLLVIGEGKEYRFAVGLNSVLAKDGKNGVATPSLYKDMLLMANINDSAYYAYLMEKYANVSVLSPRFQGKTGFLFENGEAKTVKIPEYSAAYNEYNSTVTGKLMQSGEFKGMWKVTGSGFYSSTIRHIFRFKKEKEIDISLQNLIKRFGNTAKVDSYKLNNIDNRWKNPEVTVYLTSSDFALPGQYTLEFTVPLAPATHRYAMDKERKLPLYLGAKRRIKDSLNVSFDVLYNATVKPEDTTLSSAYNTLYRKVTFENKQLVFSTDYRIKSIEVPIEGFDNFKKVEGEYFDKNNRLFMLEMINRRGK